MRIIIDKNKSKIKSFNITPTEDGFELKMIVKDDDIATNKMDVFSKVQFEFADDEETPIPVAKKKTPVVEEEVIPPKKVVAEEPEEEDRLNKFNKRVEELTSSIIPGNLKSKEQVMETKGKSILVVEDDLMINKAITNKLTKSGYVVYSAKDGEEGIEKILDNMPDLIITDVMMPYINGLELIEFVRKNLRTSIPVIVLSSLEDEESILKSFKVGADDYLSKPFGPEELILRVRRLLMFTDNMSKNINININKGKA
ncbi:MAG: response regulator transcription factor [Bacteroidales bacterium]|nr:response regulator transcription factor [Bacteroidales bacterium]